MNTYSINITRSIKLNAGMFIAKLRIKKNQKLKKYKNLYSYFLYNEEFALMQVQKPEN